MPRLDVEEDEVVTFDEDQRCGEAYMTVEDPAGDLYFFPSSLSSPAHFFADAHRPTCVLRVRHGESEFDPDYSLDLSKLGSGSAAVGAVPDGKTGFYFGSADETLWEDREDNGGALWRVWHYDFESEVSEEVSGVPTWGGDLYYVAGEGDFYIPYWTEDDAGQSTTLFHLEAGAAPQELFSFEASWAGFAKLR